MKTALLLALLSQAATQQPSAPRTATEQDARSWASAAASQSRGDTEAFHRIFQQLAQGKIKGYSRVPFVPFNTDDFGVFILGPIQFFEQNAAEVASKLKPIDSVKFDNKVVVLIAPSTISAPNIERVVVQRGDKDIDGDASELKEETETTAMNVSVKVHEGAVTFPADVFSSGSAPVRLLLIRVSGANITVDLADRDLRKIF